MIISIDKIYKNKKNKRYYSVLFISKDCTNSREGGKIVEYVQYKNGTVHFARDIEEFKEKFEEV